MLKINVSAAVVHAGKVLIVQRSSSDAHFPGAWGVPGGGREELDQTLQNALIREVKEEVGLTIKPKAILGRNIAGDNLFITFEAEVDGEVPETLTLAQDELQSAQWISTVAELEGKEFTPATKELLSELLS